MNGGNHLFCLDYRKLDDATIYDSYPIQKMEDRIDSFDDSTVYSALSVN